MLHREYCDYRKLTDLPVGTSPPEASSAQNLSAVELGNKVQLPSFQMGVVKKEAVSPPAKRSRRVVEKELATEKVPEGKTIFENIQKGKYVSFRRYYTKPFINFTLLNTKQVKTNDF